MFGLLDGPPRRGGSNAQWLTHRTRNASFYLIFKGIQLLQTAGTLAGPGLYSIRQLREDKPMPKHTDAL
jgi:hypothetical protein